MLRNYKHGCVLAFSSFSSFFMLLLAGMLISVPALSRDELSWGYNELVIGMGAGQISDEAIIVTADSSGKAFVSVRAPSVPLEDYPLVTFHFAGEKPLTRLLLIWRVPGQAGPPQQFELPVNRDNPLTISMEGIGRWAGQAEMLGLGIYLPPGQSLALRSISVSSPTVITAMGDVLADWSHFAPWHPSDINLHTGTRVFNEGLSPSLFFALVLLALVVIYLLWLRSSNTRRLDWRVLASVVLLCWIFLDGFWQLRLFRQLSVTHEEFAGKTNIERLQASVDRPYVQLARAVRESIGNAQDVRVFLGSANDKNGMSTAYYISPLNTYWHRNGPELPPASNFKQGDYVLLVRPSNVAYDRAKGVLVLDGGSVPVEPMVTDPMGLLLRVK